MARQEADRDDLWGDLVAMTSKVELCVEGYPAPLLIGYRDNGWCSIYFGQDVMLQFTTDGELRRAYRQGELFRTHGTSLARLRRHRTPEQTTLLRRDLTPAELADFRQEVHGLIQQLLTEITSGRAVIRRAANLLLPRVSATLRGSLNAKRFLAPPISAQE
jgi:hypothetical protein